MTNPFTRNIEAGDKILVNRDDVTYQADVDTVFDNARDDDLILVNYQGVTYTLPLVDVTDTAKDSALVLINRGNTTYTSTLGDLRGVAVQPVTFNVEIRTPQSGWNFTGNTTCSNSSGTVAGGKITAQVTAKSNDTYYFSNGTLYINDEWILVCGASGEYGFRNSWTNFGDSFGVCATAQTSGDMLSKGLSAVGVSNIGAGGGRRNWGQGPGQGSGVFGHDGAGGFGCPPGATGSPANQGSPGVGGGSQSRPRAENTGTDTWNEITVTNIGHSTGNWNAYNAISANGKTLTASSGVIGDLLPD